MERKLILGGFYFLLALLISHPSLGLANRGPETTPSKIDINIPQLKYEIPKLQPPPRTHDSLDTWLAGLQDKECNKAECLEYGFRIVDVNGYYSYSCLQFQKYTFESYSRLLSFSGDINKCSDQIALARLMILSNWNNWSHWYHSVVTRGLGYPPRT